MLSWTLWCDTKGRGGVDKWTGVRGSVERSGLEMQIWEYLSRNPRKDSEMEICSFVCRRTVSVEETDSSGAREVLHSCPALGQGKQSLAAPTPTRHWTWATRKGNMTEGTEALLGGR